MNSQKFSQLVQENQQLSSILKTKNNETQFYLILEKIDQNLSKNYSNCKQNNEI